ncbi:hypothetical protein K456DRAFT_1355936 [Colletotrichum gloeosporioides 23]|nr:hypothetical protein K456DRAFT_1355936 [Colletotrichum gloeosporioides 23]
MVTSPALDPFLDCSNGHLAARKYSPDGPCTSIKAKSTWSPQGISLSLSSRRPPPPLRPPCAACCCCCNAGCCVLLPLPLPSPLLALFPHACNAASAAAFLFAGLVVTVLSRSVRSRTDAGRPSWIIHTHTHQKRAPPSTHPHLLRPGNAHAATMERWSLRDSLPGRAPPLHLVSSRHLTSASHPAACLSSLPPPLPTRPDPFHPFPVHDPYSVNCSITKAPSNKSFVGLAPPPPPPQGPAGRKRARGAVRPSRRICCRISVRTGEAF